MNRSKQLQVFVLISLLLIVAFEVLPYSVTGSSAFASPMITLTEAPTGNAVLNASVNVGKLSGENGEYLYFNVVPIISAASVEAKPVYVFFDQDYGTSYSTFSAQLGIYNHLKSLLENSKYQSSISLVNASQLAQIMKNDPQSIIVMGSGVFPDTVFSNTTNLVSPWLGNGGVMFWIGDVFGINSAHAGQPVSLSTNLNIGWGQQRILNFTLSFHEKKSYANVSSTLQQELGLEYSQLRFGLNINTIISHHGLVLGKIGGVSLNSTSIGAVPVGAGWLIIFGGDLGEVLTSTGSDLVANDIFKIVSTSVLFSGGILGSELVSLSQISDKQISSNVLISASEVETLNGAEIIAYTNNQYDAVFFRVYVNNSSIISLK